MSEVRDDLASHVMSLGGLVTDEGPSFEPFDDKKLIEIEHVVEAPIPPVLRWWWSTFGGAVKFAEPAVYRSRSGTEDIVLGWFLDAPEVLDTLDDYSGALHPHRFPILDDGGGNLLVVDRDGSVWAHIHDALLDRNTYRVADSLEQFILSLRRGE